jgi:aspartyl protease family protein
MSMGGTLFWAGVLIVGVTLMAPTLGTVEEMPAPTTTVEEDKPDESGPAGNGFASRELVRSPDGHFYAEAQVNGARVRFMVDTGASFVALTRADAQRAGIQPSEDPTIAMSAGGEVDVVPVTIDRIAIGSLAATRVRGAVVDELEISLLGQSFLERVGSVEIRGDRMILR